MINCCYNRSVHLDDLEKPSIVAKPESCIGTTSSLSNYVDRQNRIVYVDTIGYGDVRFHQDCHSFLVFFHELISYSSIGFNWVFLCLRYQQITEDLLVYFQTVKQLLGEKSLARCTIVFTHCPIDDMTQEKFLQANNAHPDFVNVVQSAKNVIFGDMETENPFKRSANNPPECIQWYETQLFARREKFMKQMLAQIDEMDDGLLELQQEWATFYWTKFKSFLGYCWEKLFRQSNELSRLYQLTTKTICSGCSATPTTPTSWRRRSFSRCTRSWTGSIRSTSSPPGCSGWPRTRRSTRSGAGASSCFPCSRRMPAARCGSGTSLRGNAAPTASCGTKNAEGRSRGRSTPCPGSTAS